MYCAHSINSIVRNTQKKRYIIFCLNFKLIDFYIGKNAKPQDIYDIPIKSEPNSAYKMKELTCSEISTSQNCSYIGTTNVCDMPIYDDIAEPSGPPTM